ncbi:hypothetical protein WK90_32625 [Burkholderia cepacia]|uniref:hypothetical protein n=1 Tax=Burkholderia cepacia TaxID=292 RepID=UPI000757D60A|nr:hypothetical protein [Burkholderia cepacia]KVV50141.1 hypothetical protein WK83_32455 [Burkholderia cepacia]KVV67364.1 hypothetical protein WK85_24140 [Burkholderia cepacia]KVV70634.1 hypothetical protein WK84_13355 [Burkholderia cepacia]KVV77041.1 hypothetical protein WK87_34395 [Burkholderia cepacia]KVV85157.1 hypothetical protein WK86_11410 [Burkholderia cepacia]
MTTVTKERIYDEQISPLMTQIIVICKEHGIPIVASFFTPGDDDPELAVTTALLGNGFEAPKNFGNALRELRPELFGRAPLMLRTDHGDGSTTLTAVL